MWVGSARLDPVLVSLEADVLAVRIRLGGPQVSALDLVRLTPSTLCSTPSTLYSTPSTLRSTRCTLCSRLNQVVALLGRVDAG